MLAGPRAASIPLQVVALVLGIVEGVLLHYGVVGAIPVVLQFSQSVVATLNAPLLFLSIGFSAYFLAAPASWRGLARRALLLLTVTLLGYAVLGYLVAFALTRGVPVPGSMPSLILAVQSAIVVLGVGTLVGYLILRDRREPDSLVSATVPAQAGPVPPLPGDPQA